MIDYSTALYVGVGLVAVISFISLVELSCNGICHSNWGLYLHIVIVISSFVLLVSINPARIHYLQYGKENYINQQIEQEKTKLLLLNVRIQQLENLRGNK